jgi:hypothetical protein
MDGDTAKVRRRFGCLNHSWLTTVSLVVTDGYGLSYAIGQDYLRWVVTCLRTNTKNRLGQDWKDAKAVKAALEEAADETAKMLEEGDAQHPHHGAGQAKL